MEVIAVGVKINIITFKKYSEMIVPYKMMLLWRVQESATTLDRRIHSFQEAGSLL